jgi:hypothetical protein
MPSSTFLPRSTPLPCARWRRGAAPVARRVAVGRGESPSVRVAPTRGAGGGLAWPALLRKLDARNPGWRD